ncbi:protein ZNF365 [Coturnix japonica]|uniref:Zinc finger protein 365 n=1 Tax=Coturnix japonica TaxID=93934 RepID=A0A8C2U148_COTJA|nr:protein ZNF365 [Coturnix japonica]
MQQDAAEQSGFPWQDALGDAGPRLPFRCPRCGERSRFRSLSALRAHLEYGHGYEERGAPPKGGPASPRKGAGPASPPEPCGPGGATRYVPCAGCCDASSGSAEGRRALEAERGPGCCVAGYGPAGPTRSRLPSPVLPAADSKASFEAHVREKFSRMVEAVDKTIEKRIDKLTKELAQKTAELLEVRAAFVQLSQKKQEVQRRERALSRQVDVAVEMIAALKQRLTESEEELHRKEEEVVTFNHFLEEAAEKEVRGKARLQHFIENLLQRVDLAERQLEYYQNQQIACNHTGGSDHVFTDISLNKKPRCLSRGSQHTSYNIPDTKPHSFQKGRCLLKKAKEEKTSLQPVRYFYEPVDCPREIWRAQKKGEPVCSARKLSAKSKMGKKTKQL